MTQALLLVDLQNDFCQGGALAVDEADLIIPIANQLMQQFSLANKKVIATLDWHPLTHKSFAVNSGKKVGEIGTLEGLPQLFWPVHCVENQYGSELHPELHSDLIDKKIYKGLNEHIDSYSAFFDNARRSQTELDEYLKQNSIDTLYILGLATDYCVKFSALDGLSLGYNVYLVTDGCRGVNLHANDSELALQEVVKKGANLIESDALFDQVSYGCNLNQISNPCQVN